MAMRALTLTGYGLNCEQETDYALKLAGAQSDLLHINEFLGNTDIEVSSRLRNYQMLVFIGGFCWADDHGAGVLFANRMRQGAGDALQEFIAGGNLVMGICNGFQVLVNLGLLPGIDANYQKRQVALVPNDSGNFRDAWVHLKPNRKSPCVFTQGIETIDMPIRHGEGKFIANAQVMAQLEAKQQIALQYATADYELAKGVYPDNPNGSLLDVAGICDSTGRVFGLMPHPEAYNHYTNHPQWTRRPKPSDPIGAGIQLFRNAVRYFS